MQKTRHMTNEEIDHLGYQALKERLGIIGAARFIGLQAGRAGEDYAAIKDKIFEGMTVRDIYEEAVRLEAGREAKSGEKSNLP